MELSAQAIPGQPFGFGIVSVPLPPGSSAAYLTNGFLLTEDNHRVFYPVVTHERAFRLLDVLRSDNTAVPPSVSVLFLFRGEGPLKLTLFTPTATRLTVTPAAVPLGQAARTWNRWWQEYLSSAKRQMESGDYPPLIETYLTTMLSRRLGLPLIDEQLDQPGNELQRTIELLSGSEKLRTSSLRRIMLLENAGWPSSNLPLPRDITWSSRPMGRVSDDLKIEPIAEHVPEDCFYVRFGSFTNFLWLDRLTAEYGGDLSRMITLRGHRSDLSQKLQNQMAVQQDALAELLGEQVVADQALVGYDMLLPDGAAVGVVIQARNQLFAFGMQRQRSAAAEREKNAGAKLETIQIAGRDVSFLSTPDGRLRSFYAVDGDFHLMTTSRRIVEGFFRAGAGERSLANNPDFRHARTLLPVEREDTIFVFLPALFLQQLISPQYQVEVLRRRRSLAEIDLLHLARRAAIHEQIRHDSVDDLVQAQLLPPGFAQRSDGSELVMDGEHIIDSVRGARGYFVPVPDMNVDAVSLSELDSFARQATFFHEKWQEMDSLAIAVKRYALDIENRERIVIEGNVSPLVEKKYGRILEMIGTPVAEQVRPLPEDAVWIQAALSGSPFNAGVGPHHLFLGVQDVSPLAGAPTSGLLGNGLLGAGLLSKFRMIRSTPAYLGSWPEAGLLDRLPLGLAGRPDPAGFSRFPLGLWRRQMNGFSVLSFDSRLLADVTTRLRPEPTENPAQIRAHVSDISQTKIAQLVNSETYTRALDASIGNAKFLHTLSQQLGVDRPSAMSEAERLLNVKLVCSLDGAYQLEEVPGGVPLWRSTGWPNLEDRRLPNDFQAPVLKWFRGLDADVTKFGDRILVKAQVDLERHPAEPKIDLPLFNLFGGATGGQATESNPKPGLPSRPEPKKRSRDF